MRVFLPPNDERKVAAKKQPAEEQPNQQQQQPRKKFKRTGSSGSNNSNSDNNNTSKKISMGGGGRLVGSAGGHPAPAAALKSSSDNNDGEERHRQRNNAVAAASSAASSAATATVASRNATNNEFTDSRRGDGRNDNNGPHSAVAAAASSPHRSTINSSSRTQNPEDDDWQDNDAKQSSSRYIFSLGKSNPDGNQNSTLRYLYKSSHRSSTLSSSSMQSSSAPLLNGPIPGSQDDPATMSKTDYEATESYRNNTNSTNNDSELDNGSIMSRFIHLLRTQHKPPLDMIEMEGDGNCLFRAISLQVYGDQSMHLEARQRCLDFMEREADHFKHFVADEDFAEYVARKRMEGVHGNHAEIQAMSELYNRSIEVFVPNHGIEPINIFHLDYKSNDAPIRLCYMDGNHYNAVIDPLVPTAGLGLGLPGLQPGLADKLQLEEAKKISDDSAMEEKMRLALEESNRVSQAREEIDMKEALRKSSELAPATVDSDEDIYKKKAMYLSEIEAADFDLEQAVLASSLESYRQAEQERKPPSSRRGEGRRSRFNSSPRGQRSSSNSPVYRSNQVAAAASNSSSNHYYAASAAAAGNSSAASNAYEQSAAAGRNNEATTTDEYPASVQELVMNGFELSKVLHAYDLVGDNFDDLLSFLLSSST